MAPWNSSVDAYKHFSNHPKQWKAFYNVTNTRAVEFLADAHFKYMCEKAIRERIKSYHPDVVVSVHPLMNSIPIAACKKIDKETGRHIPFFTVVTDLGSAHAFWFANANGADKVFIASEQIKKLAKSRGKITDDKLEMIGLPIRHDFSVQAGALGDRMSEEGKQYQKGIREKLGVDPDAKTLLVMGGGEGVGSLSSIVESLYAELVTAGIDATILVICGRNEKLKRELEDKDWSEVTRESEEFRKVALTSCWAYTPAASSAAAGCFESNYVTMNIRKILSTSSLTVDNAIAAPLPDSDSDNDSEPETVPELAPVDDNGDPSANNIVVPAVSLADSMNDDGIRCSTRSVRISNIGLDLPGRVNVVGLGFITNMAEYMVAADILITKAGPGTIAEAASVGLPVMLTSFLPGQEEGNVDFVVKGEFGMYCPDTDPWGLADEVVTWLLDEEKLRNLSVAAKKSGAPDAAAEIVRVIGEDSLKWKEINNTRDKAGVTKNISPVPSTELAINISSASSLCSYLSGM